MGGEKKSRNAKFKTFSDPVMLPVNEFRSNLKSN